MPIFLLSFFEASVGVYKSLDFYLLRFFWLNNENTTKYKPDKWDILSRTKYQGGLGIENLKVKNKFLLSKWLYRLLVHEDGVWI